MHTTNTINRMRPDLLTRQLLRVRDPVVCTVIQSEPVVLFSGTRNIRDVFDDLDLRTCEASRGRVHCGTYQRSKRLWDDEVHNFVKAQPEGGVHIAGWSLGGGCAVHTASLIRSYNFTLPKSIHIFGSPRCGDDGFARWYSHVGLGMRTTRYELERDPIVTVPRGRYTHVGRRVLLTSDDEGGLLGQHDLMLYHSELGRRLRAPSWSRTLTMQRDPS